MNAWWKSRVGFCTLMENCKGFVDFSVDGKTRIQVQRNGVSGSGCCWALRFQVEGCCLAPAEGGCSFSVASSESRIKGQVLWKLRLYSAPCFGLVLNYLLAPDKI